MYNFTASTVNIGTAITAKSVYFFVRDIVLQFHSCLFTDRGQILGIESVPHSPIDSTNSCIRAGSDVRIVCANIAYPVGIVEFTKEGIPVDLSTNR